MRTALLLIFLSGLILVGCGGGGGGGGGGAPPGDTTPPQVAGVIFPSDGSVDVDIPDITRVTVNLSEAPDPASVTSSSFRVTTAAGVAVPATIAVDAPIPFSGQTPIRLAFQQPLARSTQYRVEVTTAVRDLAGNALAAAFQSSFTTITDSAWRATSVTSTTAGARSEHAAVWTGSEMIVFGGLNAAGAGNGEGARYNPVTDSWTAMASGTRQAPVTAVWTGTEMVVWDGFGGERYNPASNSWLLINPAGAPATGFDHTSVWTGTVVIVWGGRENLIGPTVNAGGLFNPGAGSWSATSTGPGVPSPRYGHSAVWTGTEMIIWGGALLVPVGDGTTTQTLLGDGARYNPATNTWTPVSSIAAPGARLGHTAVWTGQEMIIWGGTNPVGARYNPVTDTWAPVASESSVLSSRPFPAVWTGTEMIVWQGSAFRGRRYNPATNSWRPVTRENAPTDRFDHTAIWTGTEMIVWGGVSNQDGPFVRLQTGARYAP